MTNESPQFPDDESRRIQAEIDRIRSGLKWLRAGQPERSHGQESFGQESLGDDPGEDSASEAEDLRSLAERMQSIVDRARIHAERFERLMGRTPEGSVATFAEVQQMLSATLAKGRAKRLARKRARRKPS